MEPYEYLPLNNLLSAFGIWSKCEDQWQVLENMQVLEQNPQVMPSLDAGAPVILDQMTEQNMQLEGSREEEPVLVLETIVVRQANRFAKCPVCGCAIRDGGAVSQMYPAVICTQCEANEQKSLAVQGKCSLGVPELDNLMPECCMCELTKKHFKNSTAPVCYRGTVDAAWAAKLCRTVGTPNAAVALGVHEMQARFENRPTLRVKSIADEITAAYPAHVVSQAAGYLVRRGTRFVSELQRQNEDSVSAILSSIHQHPRAAVHFGPMAACVDDLCRRIQDMDPPEIITLLYILGQRAAEKKIHHRRFEFDEE